MKDKNFKKLIDELRDLDGFKDQDQEQLKDVIDQLQFLKPEVDINERFSHQLKDELLGKSQEKETTNMKLVDLFKIKQFQIVSGVLVLAIALLGAVMVFDEGQQKDISLGDFGQLLSYEVNKVGSKAFGDLSFDGSAANLQEQATGRGSAAAPQSSEAAKTTEDYAVPSPGFGGGGGIAPRDFARYEFVYEGGEFDLSRETVNVLRRRMGVGAQSDLIRALASADLGLINLGSFRNTSVESFQITEPGNQGFRIFVNLADGQISVDKNIVYEDRVYNSPDELPEDSRAIQAANQFLSRHGVSTAQYGEPYVAKEWLVAYEQTVNKQSFYIPNFIRVVYPLVLEGETVYEQSGQEVGLSVNVLASDLSVSGIWGLSTQTYDSSAYSSVTDKDRVFEILRQGGGMRRPYPESSEARVVQIGVGTPVAGLMRVYNYDYQSNSRSELYVPSLIFPVTNIPDGEYYWQENIVVPLVTDILDEFTNPPIRPLLEEASQ